MADSIAVDTRSRTAITTGLRTVLRGNTLFARAFHDPNSGGMIDAKHPLKTGLRRRAPQLRVIPRDSATLRCSNKASFRIHTRVEAPDLQRPVPPRPWPFTFFAPLYFPCNQQIPTQSAKSRPPAMQYVIECELNARNRPPAPTAPNPAVPTLPRASLPPPATP